jgi:hypothetical protein
MNTGDEFRNWWVKKLRHDKYLVCFSYLIKTGLYHPHIIVCFVGFAVKRLKEKEIFFNICSQCFRFGYGFNHVSGASRHGSDLVPSPVQAPLRSIYLRGHEKDGAWGHGANLVYLLYRLLYAVST